jgi:hypothetical protein
VVPRACKTGRKGTLFGARRSRQTRDPTCPATFQTVSRRVILGSSLPASNAKASAKITHLEDTPTLPAEYDALDPSGEHLLDATVIELDEDGKIVRHLEVQAWDE